jgi:acetolactate synthase-1/2/3 large subunit
MSEANVDSMERSRVLVVDDDTLYLRAIERRMRRDPEIELTVVDNAVDALLRLEALAPDVVVLDALMPGMDGVEACRRIKSNLKTHDIEVVIASAALTPELEHAAQQAGAARAIDKPIDFSALRAPAAVATLEPRPATSAESHTPGAMLRGADLLVAMLAEAGVEAVFGLPGGAISPVHDALLDSSVRVVTTRHESGAMFAAAGYARATGKLGVVAVTSGPGALNALTGLASAWCDGLPVLLLVGEVPRPSQGKGVLQDGSAHGLQIVEMARYVTKLAAEVPSNTTLPHMIRRAITTALSGRKGPVLLTLPIDVMTARVTRPRAGGTVCLGGLLEPPIMEEVARLAREAKRPLLFAGSGVRGGNAPHSLRLVAERLGCPVATTPKAKGVFPEDHALALGVFGLGGHPSAGAYVDSGVDLVIAVGTSMGDLATDGFSRSLQAPALVQVDIDARQLGKSYAPTHAIVASAEEFLGTLADCIGKSPRPVRPLAGITRHALRSSSRPGRVASHDAIRGLQRMLPRDTIYTVDSGEHFVFATHYLEISRPDSYIVMTGLGSMGQSIGAAIGAQLANPGRTVAAICGDGCFAMNAFEIATARELGLPIRIFVFNDERLAMVENGHAAVYGRRPRYGSGLVDVCAIARGLGAAALRVDSLDRMRDAAALLVSARSPIVIDIGIDETIALPKRDRVAALSSADASPPSPRHQHSERLAVI